MVFRTAVITALVFGLTQSVVSAQKADSSARHLAVRAGRLIDGRGGPPRSNAVILIDSTRITAVGSNLPVPPGTPVIDLGSATVLPGLFDCHTHITSGDPGDYYTSLFRRSPIDYAVAAPTFARREEQSAGAPQYSQEELNALVEEATQWGRKVAAHAHGAEAIKRAVRAVRTDANAGDSVRHDECR